MKEHYLPGQPVVPCAYCSAPIDRTQDPIRDSTRKYCSEQCRRMAGIERPRVTRERERAAHPAGPDRSLCPRCRVNKRVPRPSGKLRGWCGPCEARQKDEYNKSAAGKATVRRYAEYHGLIKTPPEIPCLWCGTSVSLRGIQGAGQRKYCSKACRSQARNHRDRQKRKNAE